jgi:hypothetical protein
MEKADIIFVIYKRIDEDTGDGEERLKIIVDGVERFEDRAAALIREYEETQETQGGETAEKRKAKKDPRLQDDTRESMLAAICVEQRFFRGWENGKYDYRTLFDPGYMTRPIRNQNTGKIEVHTYRDDSASGDSILMFKNALQRIYLEKCALEEEARKKAEDANVNL